MEAARSCERAAFSSCVCLPGGGWAAERIFAMKFSKRFNIHIHGFALLNYNCVILDTSPVHIGAGTFIAPGVCLACSGHAIDPIQRSQGIGTSAPITIEENVWIGANATVCGGVTIGTGSVIGAGSVVNHDIPANVIAAGVPCKVIRPITEKDKIKPEEILF